MPIAKTRDRANLQTIVEGLLFFSFLSTPCNTAVIFKAHKVIFFGGRYPVGIRNWVAGIEIQLLTTLPP